MHLVLVVFRILRVVPEQALYLRDDCAQSSEEWSNHHLIPIPRVNWLACLSEDEKVLPNLIEFSEFLPNINVPDLWVDVILVEELCYVWVNWCLKALRPLRLHMLNYLVVSVR
jgi:hypothetical protein